MTVETVQLGEVADYIRGITFKPADVVPPHSTKSVVCMTTKNVQETLDESKLIAVPPRFVKRKEQYLQAGDILISSANSWNLVGKACFVPQLPYITAAGGFISILRARGNRIYPRYLYHWMVSGKTQHRTRLCARQTTNIANLDRERFLRLRIPLPPLPEQRRIAAILDKADAVRRKRQQTLALADQFLRSAFLDMFGDPVTNPKGWPVRKLGEVAEVQGGLQVTSKRRNNPIEVQYLRVANVYRDALDLTEVKTIRVTATELKRATLKIGDVLIVEGHGNRNEVGRSAVWDGSVDPCVHQNHLIRVRPSEGVLASQYLSFYLNSSGGRRQMFRSGKTTSGLNTISTRNVKETKVLLPPIEEQEEFVRLRRETTQARHCLESGIAMAERISASLIQRAFRGEV